MNLQRRLEIETQIDNVNERIRKLDLMYDDLLQEKQDLEDELENFEPSQMEEL